MGKVYSIIFGTPLTWVLIAFAEVMTTWLYVINLRTAPYWFVEWVLYGEVDCMGI